MIGKHRGKKPLVQQGIEKIFQEELEIRKRSGTGGGCINDSAVLELSNGERVFVKENSASHRNLFKAEKTGLEALAAAKGPRVPEVLYIAEDEQKQVLILEYIPTAGAPARKKDFFQRFGGELAELHRTNRNDLCGFTMDNHIGATPQPNPWTEGWLAFFAESRIEVQRKLAVRLGRGTKRMIRGVESFISIIDNILIEERAPSLIHGDLWGGNYLCSAAGEAVLIDPAVSYSHREADLAMTELFGGFPREFYQGYQEAFPLEPGYRERADAYNLYHMLNHLNLFGESYAGNVLAILKRFGCI